jgi:hypothetical protein
MRKSTLAEDAVGMRIDKWLWAARFLKRAPLPKMQLRGQSSPQWRTCQSVERSSGWNGTHHTTRY